MNKLTPLIGLTSLLFMLANACSAAVAFGVNGASGAAGDSASLPSDLQNVTGVTQQAHPEGGRIVLWSRNRHGNYPLSTFAFDRGLRGDHPEVGNKVQLVFGNCLRSAPFQGAHIDSFPGSSGGSGAAGMDMRVGGEEYDDFRVGLHGGTNKAAIHDLGKVNFSAVTRSATLGADKQDNAGSARVYLDHTYLVMYQESDMKPHQIKLHVLSYRDNDAVLFEWIPLE